jgi:predicted nucleic acid-binding protein
MSLYIDASALLKLYLDEPDSDRAEEIMSADPEWITGRHTKVEVRRNLARALKDRAHGAAERQFQRDWEGMSVVELTREVCDVAVEIAVTTHARSLDALHLAAARVVGGGTLPFLTFDLRQAQVARTLGWVVLGN